MLGYIDLIFGVWVYNDELQIKFTFHSCPMIFGRVMALGLLNFAKYLVVSPLYFTMIWDIDLIVWYECIIISYRSTFKFVPVEWFFANSQSLGFEIWIGQEWNVNLICNSSLYTHTPKIKSIYPSMSQKVVTTKYLAKFQSPRVTTRTKKSLDRN
jgi:hypothetical protein